VLIHRERRYVVITPPKTGSNSLIRLLAHPQFGASLYHDHWHHNTAVPADCAGFRVYLSVRHPMARAVSLYRHLARDEWGNEPVHPFPEFCRRILLGREGDPFFWRPLGEWAEGLELAGVIRIEHAREDLAALEPSGSYVLPHDNQDPALRPPEWYYDQHPEALDLVAEWAAADMERFGYLSL
jgi:hypothetical protein